MWHPTYSNKAQVGAWYNNKTGFLQGLLASEMARVHTTLGCKRAWDTHRAFNIHSFLLYWAP